MPTKLCNNTVNLSLEHALFNSLYLFYDHEFTEKKEKGSSAKTDAGRAAAVLAAATSMLYVPPLDTTEL